METKIKDKLRKSEYALVNPFRTTSNGVYSVIVVEKNNVTNDFRKVLSYPPYTMFHLHEHCVKGFYNKKTDLV